MTRVEVVSVSGSIAYLPLEYVKSNDEGLWVKTDDGCIEPAWKTIDLYIPNKDVSLEDKKEWANDSPYERIKR